ncbi:MAG: peptidylprolyl isomerase [Anaerolineales bacterium]|nr:peptidylprolyl isomerase [Anaerolineales bacterium]
MPRKNKFVAQKEKEDLQKRTIIISTIVVLVAVFSLVAYGVLDKYVLKPKTPIVQLDSRNVNVVEFEQRVRYQRFQIINQTYQLIEFVQSLGGTPDIFAYFEQQIILATTQLSQPLLIGEEVIQTISDDLIILAEAEKMGIEVDEAQIDQEIRSVFGYFPEGTPTPIPINEPLPTSTMTSLQMTLVPPTDSPEEDQEENQSTLPTNTPQIEEAPEGEPDPTATPLLIPTEYTLDLYEVNYQNYMDVLTNEEIKEQTFRDMVGMYLVRKELMNILSADITQTQEQIWVRHILVEDELTALEVTDKLADGQDFVVLAAEYSSDETNKDNGGDLGWFALGMMVQPFEEAAFALEVGEISDPVQTDFGWHILQALGKEQMPIDEAALENLRNQAFSEWMIEKRLEYEVEINEDWISFVPSEPVLPQEVIDYIQFQTSQQPAPAVGP